MCMPKSNEKMVKHLEVFAKWSLLLTQLPLRQVDNSFLEINSKLKFLPDMGGMTFNNDNGKNYQFPALPFLILRYQPVA